MTTSSHDSSASINGAAQLAAATEQLRNRVEPRAVEIADGVLAEARRSARLGLPIRGRGPWAFVYVSDQVLISRLRRHVDEDASACAVGQIYLRVNPDATLQEVTIELFVQYGSVITTIADRVRAITAHVLTDALGPGSTDVAVVLTHVHVSDITRGDPTLTDPADG